VIVGRRALSALLVLAAVYADSRGSHALAFYAILGAIPLTAVAGLECFGSYLDRRGGGLQALLWTLALGLLVLSCAARSPQTTTLPVLGRSALVGALAVFVIKACVGVAPSLRRLALAQPVKP
jgi:cyanate permease